MFQAIVREHWAKYRPTEWAAMSRAEQAQFVRRQSAQIERRIDARVDLVEASLPDDLPYQERLARVQTARTLAESEVLREMLPEAENDQETYL